jgi:uncharacterized protein YidB (DUF937 family)
VPIAIKSFAACLCSDKLFKVLTGKDAAMGIMDGVLGGLVSAGVTALAKKVIEDQGGLQGLVGKLNEGGLGSIVQSWIGTGANQPVAPDQLQQALGHDALSQLAAKFGLSPEDVSAKLAAILPEAVDKMTPNGRVEDAA